jgi:predicted lactoylglutathione lyase
MDESFMYFRSFQDLDGHVWEIMFMEPDAANRT